jgi:hypothetical protein
MIFIHDDSILITFNYCILLLYSEFHKGEPVFYA